MTASAPPQVPDEEPLPVGGSYSNKGGKIAAEALTQHAKITPIILIPSLCWHLEDDCRLPVDMQKFKD
eukprot:6177186-Pleurochrysis_carterae.AAC.1